MTVSSIVPVNTYAGNGSVKRFDFDYLVENPSQLLVQLTDSQGVQTDLVYGVDYSIDKFNEQNGSFIIYPLSSSSHSILSSEEKITLSLELDIEQEKEYENSSKLYLETLEFSLDYLTRICQIQQRQIDRAIKVQEGSDIIPEELVKELFEAELNAKNSANEAAESARIATEQATIAVDTVTGFDAHAKEKQDAFDNNYNDKLVAFNINAVDKQNAFDINAATLTARYDNNDLAKTNAFNQNAQDMTDGFNQNVMLKIDDFDAHAMEKEIAFDDNASAKQALVDASAAAAKQSENNAKNSENASGISEDNARESERKSRVWAEGDDPDVADLGGTHSAKKWAEIAEGAVTGEGLVTIDTDQEITGRKTFTMDLGSKSNDLDIRIDRNKRGNGLIFIDKNGTQTAGIGPYVNNNGSPECRLIASNGTQSAFAGLGTTKDGQGFFWGPEPAEGANNEDYVTSHWVQRELTKNYVAKKGDTMTGALKFGTSGYIEANKSNSTKGLAVFGSIDGYAEGASLALRDNTAEGSQAGAFKLETGNNVTGHTHTLQGNPDGSCKWDGKELIRTINGKEADATGNIETGSGLPVGSIFAHSASASFVPENSVPCDGTEYTKEQFPSLYTDWLNSKEYFDRSKIEVVGSPNITDDGIASGFTTNDYIETGYQFAPQGNWIIECNIKTGNSVNSDQYILSPIGKRINGINIQIRRTNDNYQKFNFAIGNGFSIFLDFDYTMTGLTNTNFDFIIEYKNNNYNIFINNELVKTLNSTEKVGASELIIGKSGEWGQPFLGSIDLKQFSISVDGKEVYSPTTGKLETCTYEEYAQEITTNGASAKFALDTTNEKFKVPTIPDGYYVKAGQGTANKAGLPNITGGIIVGPLSEQVPASGCVYKAWETSPGNLGGGSNRAGYGIDASLSNPIYGASDTVETNAVGYRYFVVVATGSIKQSEMDWSAWASGLQGKANVDADNFSKIGKENIAKFGIPDYNNPIATVVNLPLGVFTKFTATQDCFVVIFCDGGEINTAGIRNSDDQSNYGNIIDYKQGMGYANISVARAYVAKGKSVYLGAFNGTNNHFYNVFPLLESEV